MKRKNKTAFKVLPWMKYRKLYFIASGAMITASLFALFSWGLIFGIEFKGGVEATYVTSKPIEETQLKTSLADREFEIFSLVKAGEDRYIVKLPEISSEKRTELLEVINEFDQNAREVEYQHVGPSIGPELIKKTLFAVIISTGSILLWVAYQFKSAKFGISAILAMLHDSFILIGSFSILGHFFGAEVDFLFVTAVLTTLSFSVHDTIVVFDRIREIRKKHGGEIERIADTAVSETMRRSVVNSLTIIFMLLSLAVLGGISVRWFAMALLVGAVLGTYSSPFVAVPLLVIFHKFKRK